MVRKISQTQSLLINAATSDIREVAHAAEVIIEAMPNLAIAYGALIDGEWRKFPTRCFLAAVGLERLEFDELTYRDLANTFDMELMNQWASKPEIERTEPLVFLASNGKQISRWLELHLSRVGDVSGANFYILRDVDVEVRLEKQNQKNAKKQDAQLGALTSALNASRNGFAIWKAERDSSGNISTFTLVFINDTGAAPTGKMPRQLMGDNITRVLGEDQSRDLAVLFTQALDEHSTVSEVVQLNSPTGWVGAYLNEVVPMGDDQVLASFRDVSDDQRERSARPRQSERYLHGPTKLSPDTRLRRGAPAQEARLRAFNEVEHTGRIGNLMLSNLNGWHLLILILVVLLIFGAPKLPGLARSLGQSMRIFRSEVKAMKDDDGVDAQSDSTSSPTRAAESKNSKPTKSSS